jgi:hypothetical protein
MSKPLLRPPAEVLLDFPAFRVEPGEQLYRVHKEKNSPLYFSQGTTGRFDLPEITGRGTCYFAGAPVGAFLEVFWRENYVAESDVSARHLFTGTVKEPLILADMCSPTAGKFGINGEVHTTTDYAVTQDWARILQVHGFDGVRYLTRSDPSLEQAGIALFGPAGAQSTDTRLSGSSAAIGQELVDQAADYGVVVMPTI